MARSTKDKPVPGADLPVIDETLNPPEEQLATLVDPKREVDVGAAAQEIFGDMAVDAVDDEPVEIEFDPASAKRPVIAKMAQIMASLPTLRPLGENSHFHYNFIKDTQVSGAIRPRMAKMGLMLIPEVLSEEWVETRTSKGGISYVTKLHVRFTVIDAESGDSISGTAIGYGDDPGDKGANKALTAAEKYWLLKTFQIGGEDLEDDSRADQRASDREAGGTTSVTASSSDGVAKGGRQDKISKAQLTAIGSIYSQLRKEREWTPERFAQHISEVLGDELDMDEGEPATVLNAYLKSLSGDDAGKLITALVDEKDKDPGAEEDSGGGYSG